MTRTFVTADLFESLRQAAGEGEFTFGALEARLAEPGRILLHSLLHSAVSADDTGDEEVLREQAEACVRRLTADLRKRERDELRVRVKAAEREGQVREALSLMGELNRLERETGAGGN